MPSAPIDVDQLRRVFDEVPAGSVGLEEEVLLVASDTGLPVPAAEQLVARVADPRVKRELPPCQVELFTAPQRAVGPAIAQLAEARERTRVAAGGDVRPVAAAVHPHVGRIGLDGDGRHREIHEAYGAVAELQLVGALQVHVAVGGADVSVAVHDALRGHLPDLAALAAAAPFRDGRDTGLASVRPLVCGLLPRQGVPPAFGSFDAFAAELAWGARSGAVPEPRRWWWELRLHAVHGTLELRVPDVQPDLASAGAVAGFAHALARRLADHHADDEPLWSAPTWRIEENRWRALRDGVHGEVLDLRTGDPEPTARRLHRLVDEVAPWSDDGLAAVHHLIDHPTLDELRRVGPGGAVAWLADRF